jgi:uncharacterized protein YggU (UPF0235/DUF167 family)
VLKVRVRPGAPKDALRWHAERGWRVDVAAAAVDGAANERLLRFLARDVLGIRRDEIRLRSGHSAREKLLDIDLEAEAVASSMRKFVA